MTETSGFDLAMRQVYLDAKEAGYNATYFLRMERDRRRRRR